MSIQLDDALQTFIVESRELLQHMEDALLALEQTPDDAEAVNAIFRAAHTIKGSAGLFSLDHIVSFTHVAESVLDRVRDHRLAMSPALGGLLLEVCDHLGRLIDGVAAGQAPDAALSARSDAIAVRLREYLAPTAQPTDLDFSDVDWPDGNDVVPPPSAPVRGADSVTSGMWHISLRSGPNLLRDGMDPLSILRYLGTFGQIVNLELILGDIPPLSVIDPESCYIGYELSFASETDQASIDGAFDFVREDSVVRLIPPYGPIADYRALFADMPEDSLLLGRMLVRCGSLTEEELAQALETQGRMGPDNGGGSPAPLLGEVLVAQQLVDKPLVDAALERQQQVKATAAGEATLIRVDAAKLDQLINLVGELIIAGAGAQLVARRLKVPDLVESTSVLARLVEDVRDSALNLRMVQIGATFSRFRRVVRDVAAELGKDIQLDIQGGETELDKTVVEKIGDPLTHIVRNALDHGIEPAAQRVAAGKSAQGRLSLNAYHDSGSIVIEVSDDQSRMLD